MITTEQKTEYWMIGALQRFVQCGIIQKFKIKRESLLEEDRVDWWELDATFMSWADQQVFVQTASEYLDGLNVYDKTIMAQYLVAFTNHNTRYQMLKQAYARLLDK